MHINRRKEAHIRYRVVIYSYHGQHIKYPCNEIERIPYREILSDNLAILKR
jgi:hypothetical protein